VEKGKVSVVAFWKEGMKISFLEHRVCFSDHLFLIGREISQLGSDNAEETDWNGCGRFAWMESTLGLFRFGNRHFLRLGSTDGNRNQ
jgi:hypothetical protein